MRTRMWTIGPLVTVLTVFSLGCQTAPLSGTEWRVTEVVDPDAEDRAALEQIDAMMVEFRPDGRLVTTTFKADGTAVANTSETYAIEDDVITINDPDYELTALYRFEDGQLRIHSRQFVIVMEPIRRTAGHGIGRRQ